MTLAQLQESAVSTILRTLICADVMVPSNNFLQDITLQPAMCLSRGKEEIFLKPMHKNTNLSAFVKGKTSVLRPPLTNASKFV